MLQALFDNSVDSDYSLWQAMVRQEMQLVSDIIESERGSRYKELGIAPLTFTGISMGVFENVKGPGSQIALTHIIVGIGYQLGDTSLHASILPHITAFGVALHIFDANNLPNAMRYVNGLLQVGSFWATNVDELINLSAFRDLDF